MAKAGHIKVFRSIEDWIWFDTPGMLDFWIRLLLKAEWKGADRGSLVTSVADLAKETKCSVKQARVYLSRLVKTGEIATERARIGAETRAGSGTLIRTRITICNYDSYQSLRREPGQELGQESGRESGHPPYSPSTSSPVPSSSSPPISPSLFEEEEKKEEDAGASSKKDRIDFPLVLKLWNDSMTRKVPKIKALSTARKDKIRLRVAEMGGWDEAKRIMDECFRKIDGSEFCNGENDQRWVATFDWFFINEKNWLKVFEGNYDDRKRKTSMEIMRENIAKADAYYERQFGYGGATAYGVPPGGGQDGPDEQ